jgi:hypothetical protein
MATLPHSVQVPGGQPLVIYGETANINYFLNGDLEPDTLDEPTTATATVKAHSRRQYPGDATTISVDSASREFLKDPTRKSGAGLPGKPFVLKETTSPNGERRQFTYVGRWIDLHTFLSSEAAVDMFAYNYTGARSTIAATSAP